MVTSKPAVRSSEAEHTYQPSPEDYMELLSRMAVIYPTKFPSDMSTYAPTFLAARSFRDYQVLVFSWVPQGESSLSGLTVMLECEKVLVALVTLDSLHHELTHARRMVSPAHAFVRCTQKRLSYMELCELDAVAAEHESLTDHIDFLSWVASIESHLRSRSVFQRWLTEFSVPDFSI